MQNRSVLRCVVLAVLLCAALTPALAVDYVSNSAGDWATTTIWTPNGLPGASDNVTIDHAVTLTAAQSVNNITIGTGSLSPGTATLNVYGDWTNNGTFTSGSSTISFTGATTPQSIQGTTATTFWKLSVNKGALAQVVVLQQNVTVSANAAGALLISVGTLQTNGYDLTVNATGASVQGNATANGKLDINAGTGPGSTVTLYNIDQGGYVSGPTTTGLGWLAVASGATLNVTNTHTIGATQVSAVTVEHRADITGGTVNYSGTGSDLLFDTGQMYSQNGTSGWYATDATVTFKGNISATWWPRFRASGTTTVTFTGSTNSTITLNNCVGGAVPADFRFNDLRIEKASGYYVSIFCPPSNSPNSANITAIIGVTVNAGATLKLDVPNWTGSNGWVFGTITNNGTLTHLYGPISVSGDWTGSGTYTGSGTGAVTFNGPGANTIASNGLTFYDAVVNKTAGGSVAMDSPLNIRHQLTLTAGTFVLDSQALTIGDAFAKGVVSVAAGAAFSVVGSPTARGRVVTTVPAYPYAFTIPAAASIAARYATFSGMDQNGINVAGTVDAVDNFSDCSFEHGATTGPMLKIENDQTLDDIALVNFTGTAGYNVEKTGNTGHLKITGGSGNRWGPAFENDPANPPLGLIDWVNADVGVKQIVVPPDTLSRYTLVSPEVVVMNWSSFSVSVGVRMIIDSAGAAVKYDQTVAGIVVPASDSVNYVFIIPWFAGKPGTYNVTAYTILVADPDPANDTAKRVCKVTEEGFSGWTAKTAQLLASSGKAMKDGAWLTYDGSKELIYAAKGNKTSDFYSYEPARDSWKPLAPWLPGIEGKLPQKGSAGCADGNGVVYATKGNNTQGFWKYDATKDSWYQKQNVPLGLSNKRVKGGTDFVYAEENGTWSPYLLKGYRNEFYRYDTGGDLWQTLAPAPIGANVKWDKGSWLAYDGANGIIYAHKAKYHEFYKYYVNGDSWSNVALHAMPIPSNRMGTSKKAKEGGCGVVLGAYIYALKGGNTQEFWKYHIAGDSWSEKETIPQTAPGSTKKRKVKGGGDIVAAGSVLFAVKGNKCQELWQYQPSTFTSEMPWSARDDVMAGQVGRADFVSISPNPLSNGFATLRYSLPHAGPAQVRVCDVTGRTIMNRALAAGAGSTTLDLRRLSNGVYLVKLRSQGFVTTQKLVVQR